jgi:hypothetical protein
MTSEACGVALDVDAGAVVVVGDVLGVAVGHEPLGVGLDLLRGARESVHEDDGQRDIVRQRREVVRARGCARLGCVPSDTFPPSESDEHASRSANSVRKTASTGRRLPARDCPRAASITGGPPGVGFGVKLLSYGVAHQVRFGASPRSGRWRGRAPSAIQGRGPLSGKPSLWAGRDRRRHAS